MDRLQSMEVFVTAVERGSFAAAARALRLTPPMVGKHVSFLEQRLGVRLLSRTTRRQKLTEAGQQYFERCKQLLREVANAETLAAGSQAQPQGQLRICAPVTLGSMKLAPALTEFLAKYPRIDIELVLKEEPADLIEEGFDAAVRIGKLADSALIARALQPYRMLICAAPSYLARRGTPVTLEDLARHDCLGFTHWDKNGGWTLGRKANESIKPPHCRLRANNGQALRAAALAGAGIVMQPEALLGEDVAAGRLVGILPGFLRPPRPVSLVYVRDRRAPPKLTRFVEFMLSRFGVAARRNRGVS